MNTNYDVINSKKYFELISKPALTEQEEISTQTFEKLMHDSEKYKDYLIGSLKQNNDSYEFGINELAAKETINPDIQLTQYQKKAIDAYNTQKQNLLKLNENKIRRLQKNNNVSTGYINSFILILSVLATGILLGISLFMITK